LNGLVVSGLHKAFGDHPVLRALDLEVPAGSITAILGPSGSGKTTLFRVLAGFELPDRGTIRIGDRVLDGPGLHVAPEKRRIGYVPQEGALFPHLTVGGNVAFGLGRNDRGRVSKLLEMVGLAELTGRYPHQLSGGQQQRVALARALAVEPEVILLDEPFAALDANMRATVRADVAEILRSTGTTAVLVTHDQDEALSIADPVGVIRDGMIAQCASPQELYSRPVDAELARFVGDANIVEGTFDGTMVATSFGRLQAHWLGIRPPGIGPVTALVRPEQIELTIPSSGEQAGQQARVLDWGYHGHDAIVQLRPSHSGSLGPPLFARVTGDRGLEAGTQVLVTARGPLLIWPATVR
jgi:iron(III) transport system ATP-binding protein